MADTLRLGHGNWVSGEGFWGREKDIELFIDKIDDGANLLLVAQRRIGKTSLMHETKRRLKDRYECLFVDLEKSFDAPDAIAAMSLAVYPYAGLWSKTKRIFANILGQIEEVNTSELGIKLRAGITGGDWMAKGDELFTILAGSEKPVLLLY